MAILIRIRFLDDLLEIAEITRGFLWWKRVALAVRVVGRDFVTSWKFESDDEIPAWLEELIRSAREKAQLRRTDDRVWKRPEKRVRELPEAKVVKS